MSPSAARPVRLAGLAGLQLGSGEQVLLLPGYTGSKEDFAPILPPLAAAGFALTSIDLPGQFESPGPQDPSGYVPDALAEVVCDVIDLVALGERIHLVGHSFGGLVARAVALAAGQRLRSLALMSSGPAAIPGARRAMLDHLEPVLPQVGMAGLYDLIDAAAAAAPGSITPPPATAAFLRTRFLASSPAMMLGMGRALRDEPDRTLDLAAVGIPTLVVYGVDDDAWPPDTQADMACRLGAARVVIAEAVHSPAVENPPATAEALLTFWRSLRTETGPGLQRR